MKPQCPKCQSDNVDCHTRILVFYQETHVITVTHCRDCLFGGSRGTTLQGVAVITNETLA